jgi:hypothetical protein
MPYTYGSRTILTIISLKSTNRLIFVVVKCCAFFAVRTEYFNVLQFQRVKGLFFSAPWHISLSEKTHFKHYKHDLKPFIFIWVTHEKIFMHFLHCYKA